MQFVSTTLTSGCVTTRYQPHRQFSQLDRSLGSQSPKGGEWSLSTWSQGPPCPETINTQLRWCQVKSHTMRHGQKWNYLDAGALACAHTRHTYRCTHTPAMETFVHTFLAQQPVNTSPAQRSGLWLEPSLPRLHPQVEADPRPALAAALVSLTSTAVGSPVAACQVWLGQSRCSQASSWSELSKKSTPTGGPPEMYV